MAIWEIHNGTFKAVTETTFRDQDLRERQDLQRLIRDNIGAIAPDTMVLAEEYGDWTEGRRRIDLLCIDRLANLVVVELKRTEDGGHMELQAVPLRGNGVDDDLRPSGRHSRQAFRVDWQERAGCRGSAS